jgi:tetratricopeptide (TPR) repeat protein
LNVVNLHGTLGTASSSTTLTIVNNPFIRDLANMPVQSASSPPSAAEQLLDLSNRLYQKGRYEESIAAARKALAARPDYTEAYNLAWAASHRPAAQLK